MATKHLLGLTGPYNMLYMDAEHLSFSIFSLSSEPGMWSLTLCLPYLLGSEQKVHVNKLSCHPQRPHFLL